MFDSYCFHRGSANTTDDAHRRSVFMCYHNAFVAQTHPGRPHHDTPNISQLREGSLAVKTKRAVLVPFS
jgi:ectoine hydroxylase-related dioxygenase (phytanoyl-CoA dioxygenase family)